MGGAQTHLCPPPLLKVGRHVPPLPPFPYALVTYPKQLLNFLENILHFIQKEFKHILPSINWYPRYIIAKNNNFLPFELFHCQFGNCIFKFIKKYNPRSEFENVCKIQKNWCIVTVAPTIEHHCGHSWTPVTQRLKLFWGKCNIFFSKNQQILTISWFAVRQGINQKFGVVILFRDKHFKCNFYFGFTLLWYPEHSTKDFACFLCSELLSCRSFVLD